MELKVPEDVIKREIDNVELAIREFIEEKLREKYGDKWWKQGVPSDVRKNCTNSRDEKLKRLPWIKELPKEYSLLKFADFTDYEKIITRKDNWQDLFKDVFGNDIKKIEVRLDDATELRNLFKHLRPPLDEIVDILRRSCCFKVYWKMYWDEQI